jgi:O-antigen/teichoic acid export membrane protein
MIRSTIIMFSTFAGAGIGYTASRYIALHRNANLQKTREIYFLSHYTSIVTGIIISTLLYIFAPFIAAASLGSSELTGDVRLGALVIFFVTLNSAQNGALLGFERFKAIAVNTIISGIAQLLFLSFGAYYWGVPGVIIGMGLSAFTLWAFNQCSLRGSLPRKMKPGANIKQISRDTVSILWKFSLPAIMSSILVLPTLWFCKTLVVQTVGFEAMGHYDAAEQWNAIILFVPSTLAGIIIPILTNILAEGTRQQYQKVIKINLLINVFITVFAALAVCLLTSFILKSYGAEFSDKITFRLLVIATIPSAVAAVLGNIITSEGKMWVGFTLNFLWAVWLILFSLLFVVKMGYGATGLAVALFCAYSLLAVSSYVYMRTKITNKKALLNEND